MKRLPVFLLLVSLLSLTFGCREPAQPDPETASIREAVDDIRRQAESKDVPPAEPENSEPTGKVDSLGPDVMKPPEGASPYPGLADSASITVRRDEMRTKRAEPKAASENGDQPAPPDDAYELRFSSKTILPNPGADSLLLEAHTVITDRDFTYAFLILNEYLTSEIESRLNEFGVEILGPHAGAHKVKVPVNPERIRAVADLDFVVWIGYPEPDQKLDRSLIEARDRFQDRIKEFPIAINFFEPAASERFVPMVRDRDIVLGAYDEDLGAYSAVVPADQVDWLTERDFVLFLELVRGDTTGHDQSMSAMGVDYIRTGGPGTNFTGASTILGIMDTGFMVGSAAPTTHQDLNKWGCGRNFTSDAAGVWNDQNDHGTHVLGTIIGTGTADARNRGVATGVGSSSRTRIRAAKIWRSNGTSPSDSWMRSAMDYMDNASSCDSDRPKVINISGGATGNGLVGSDGRSRKLDAKVWNDKQAYIVCGGNNGPNAQTIWAPGVAKNALAVGNVLDNGFQTVGDVNNGSSRGPTGDGRMKPNIVGSGTVVTSADAGTTNGYTNMTGCSMATPHVSGIASTILQHYSDFRDRPYLLRAHLMATAILHDDTVTPRNNSSGGRNNYGLGRVSTYVSHWARSNPNGWNTYWATRTITNSSWGYRDITVPSNASRLVAVLTWDEPAASSGAGSAVDYDVDLWIDRGADCTPDAKGQCGEWASQSWIDNVEYLIIDNPPAGTYRLKMINWNAPSSGIPTAIVATVIRGDPTPSMRLSASSSSSNPTVGSNFAVTTTVTNPSYIASGVWLERTNLPGGLSFQGVTTNREDGVSIDFNADGITLGNIVQGDSRSATWTFNVTAAGSKTIEFRAWSENGGTVTASVTVGT